MATSETVQLTILNREGVIFKGPVKSFTSVNDRGKFDILARHENFITLVKKNVVFVDQNDQSHQMPIQQGILQVNKDRVKLFLGIGRDDLLGLEREVVVPGDN